MTPARALIVATVLVAVLLAGLAASNPPSERVASGERAEVVVTLASPALSLVPGSQARIAAEQHSFRRALARELPSARLHWRYRLVANGFSVSLARADVPRLRDVPGVRNVFQGGYYAPTLDQSPGQIGAPALWAPPLRSLGQGMKIGIIDTGVDQSHPFFDPTGYTMPTGYPKGQTRFTTAKVIVARAFPPAGPTPPGAALAFDGEESAHGTHVAGIAAGNADTRAVGGRVVSGVAPRAYIGNYKALVRSDSGGASPIENAAGLVAAIEASVRDGMDVINLSLGEPEIEPSRNVVTKALDAAAAAGVVPVVAAGNEYNEVGAGSVSSPGSAESAIAVAAIEVDGAPTNAVHADFSSVGPTPLSLLLKPEVAAPGVDIISSVPGGGWSSLSGTSMASPHVAGAAALLKQRHPTWSVAQLKSALVTTGRPVETEADTVAGPTFVGGGLVSLADADQPLFFSSQSTVSFDLLEGRDFEVGRELRLTDAGGGAGPWTASVEYLRRARGTTLDVGSTQATVPGVLTLRLLVGNAAEGETSGYVTLRRGTDVRRIPFWGRVAAPQLGKQRLIALRSPGFHAGTTAGRPALVSRYRYPEDPSGMDVTTLLRGPEAAYHVQISKRVANFGVVVTRQSPGTRVEARIVSGADENRLTGVAGLPVARNPYVDNLFESVPAVAALMPLPGAYTVVFDSATRAGAGRFGFRFWVDDVTPPTLRVRSRTVAAGRPVLVAATDRGSGVCPELVRASIDGRTIRATFRAGIVSIPTSGLSAGRHRLTLRVSDYQETKNTENVPGVLRNTRTLTTPITIRP
jgi:subtilisin family serine protease